MTQISEGRGGGGGFDVLVVEADMAAASPHMRELSRRIKAAARLRAFPTAPAGAAVDANDANYNREQWALWNAVRDLGLTADKAEVWLAPIEPTEQMKIAGWKPEHEDPVENAMSVYRRMRDAHIAHPDKLGEEVARVGS